MQVLKSSIKLLSALVLAAVLLLCCGCSVISDFDTLKINTVKNCDGLAGDSRVYDESAAVILAASEAVELCFDKSSGGICFNSLYTGKSWASLPDFANSFAASLIVDVFYGGTVYSLDSSACCADKNGISTEKTENGAIITYNLTAGEISLSVPVEIALSGAAAKVSCNISQCVISEGAEIISLQLLPYLGAVRYSAGSDYSVFGDWYLVPDGAGALMYTAVEDENSSLTFSVYGKPYYEDCFTADVAAFGVKQVGGVFAATVCDGDENALIRVFRAGADTENINRIYPEFIITPLSGYEGKVRRGNSYNGTVSVTYEFLSDADSSYVDVATSVRQALIREGLMSAQKCDLVYPLTVSFVMSTDGSRKNTTATFGQAENLLGMLKSKGVNDIDMVLLGAFEGGLEASFYDGAEVLSSAGKEKELEELLSYAKSQSLNVYAAANLLTGKSLAGDFLSGEKRALEETNPLSPYVGKESFSTEYLSAQKLGKATNKLLGLTDKYDFSGVCITDSENSIYEAFSDSKGLYEAYDDAVGSNLSSVCAATGLSLSGRSMNIIRYADRLYDVSFDINAASTGSYTAVPFVPAIIHGSVIYSGEAVNSGSVSRIALLKAVEYGGVPHYLWTSDERSDKHYDFTVNEAVEFMGEAKTKLADLSSKRITEHFLYESGVYCTGYEGGVRVYVNYNNYSVIIGEVSVMPYNFLRIG